MRWDQGEPKATSGEGGQYTLEGKDVDKYPVVVSVDTTTTDEDNPNTAISKSYVLTAPAGKTSFISPMTTLVQRQIEANPSLSGDSTQRTSSSNRSAHRTR